jgi:hypothetical protein
MLIAKQQVSKHILRITVSTIEEDKLLGNGAEKTVFSVQSVRSSYKESEE